MPGAPPYLAPPKTTASYRTVPLADVGLDALAAHVAAIPAALTPDARGRPVELMFSDDGGRPIGRTWFHRNVWAAVDAGLGASVADLAAQDRARS